MMNVRTIIYTCRTACHSRHPPASAGCLNDPRPRSAGLLQMVRLGHIDCSRDCLCCPGVTSLPRLTRRWEEGVTSIWVPPTSSETSTCPTLTPRCPPVPGQAGPPSLWQYWLGMSQNRRVTEWQSDLISEWQNVKGFRMTASLSFSQYSPSYDESLRDFDSPVKEEYKCMYHQSSSAPRTQGQVKICL